MPGSPRGNQWQNRREARKGREGMAGRERGILVTGGSTFLGEKIALALLAAGAPVSLLVAPGAEERLGTLAQRARWSTADVWSPASLRGKARFHDAVIHTVGSLRDDPARGLSHQRLNFVSARNVANMCASDGVQRLILVSGVRAPWISRQYIRSKREAEAYARRLGLRVTVMRAPLLYAPGEGRPVFFRALSLLGGLPPLSWTQLGRAAPMSIDQFARGAALLALSAESERQIYFARDLRRLLKRGSRDLPAVVEDASLENAAAGPFDELDEDTPFGWTPGDEPA